MKTLIVLQLRVAFRWAWAVISRYSFWVLWGMTAGAMIGITLIDIGEK